MRAFVAVEIPEPGRRALAELVRRLSDVEEPVKWVRGAGPATFHATLKFLGEVEDARAGAVVAAIEAAAAPIRPLKVELRGVGAFPSERRPRVVFAGLVEPTGDLARLAGAVESALEAEGFEREGRPFDPHVTIGRVKEAHPRRRPREGRKPGPAPGPVLAAAIAAERGFSAGPFEVGRVTLFKSVLGPQGPTYTAVREIALGGEEPPRDRSTGKPPQ